MRACVLALLLLVAQDPPPRAPLLAAAYDGDADKARAELEKGADPNRTVDQGTSALAIAAIRGHAKVVEALLDYGANIEDPRKSGTPLLYASAQPSQDVLRALVFAGADARCASSTGNGVFFFAAKKKLVDSIGLLAAAGAPVDLPNRADRQTALMVAAAEGDEAVVDALLAAGADPALKDAQGRDALALAKAASRDAVVRRLERSPAPAGRVDAPVGSDVRRLVDDAADGQVLALAAGAHQASFVVRGRRVILEGDPAGTTLAGAGGDANYIVAALGKADVTLRRLRLKTSQARQMAVYAKEAAVRLEDCVIEDAPDQAVYAEKAEIELRSTTFARIGGIAVAALDGSRVTVEGGGFEAVKSDALHLGRTSRAAVRDAAFKDVGRIALAVLSGSSATLAGGRVDGAGQAGVAAQEAGSLLVAGTTFSRCASPVYARKTREVVIRDCVMGGAPPKAAAIALADTPAATLSGNRLSGFELGFHVQGAVERPVGIARNILERCARGMVLDATAAPGRPAARLSRNEVSDSSAFAVLVEKARITAVGNRLLAGPGMGLTLQRGASGVFEGNLIQGDKASVNFFESKPAECWMKGDVRLGPVAGADRTWRRAAEDVRLEAAGRVFKGLHAAVDALRAETSEGARARVEERWAALHEAARGLASAELRVEDAAGVRVATPFRAYDRATAVPGAAVLWAGSFRTPEELAAALKRDAPGLAALRASLPPELLSGLTPGKAADEALEARLVDALNTLIEGPLFVDAASLPTLGLEPAMQAELRALLALKPEERARNRRWISSANRRLLERLLAGQIAPMDALADSADDTRAFLPPGSYRLVSTADATWSAPLEAAPAADVSGVTRVPGSLWMRQHRNDGVESRALVRLRPRAEREAVATALRAHNSYRDYRWHPRPDVPADAAADALRRAREALPGLLVMPAIPDALPPAERAKASRVFWSDRKAAFRILHALGQAPDVELLSKLVADPSRTIGYALVRDVVDAMASLEARYGLLHQGAVLKLLDDPRPAPSTAAAVALAFRGIGDERIFPLLLRRIEAEGDATAETAAAAWALVPARDGRVLEAMRRILSRSVDLQERLKHQFSWLSDDNAASPALLHLLAFGTPEDLGLAGRLKVGYGQVDWLPALAENPVDVARSTIDLGLYVRAMTAAQAFRDRPPEAAERFMHELAGAAARHHAGRAKTREEAASRHDTLKAQAAMVMSWALPNETSARVRRTHPFPLTEDGDSILQQLPWWHEPRVLETCVRRWIVKGNDDLEAQFAYADPELLTRLARAAAGGALPPDKELALAAYRIGGRPHVSPHDILPRDADHRAYLLSDSEGNDHGGALSGTVSLMARPDGERVLIWLKIDQRPFYYEPASFLGIGSRGANLAAWPMHRFVLNGGRDLIERVAVRRGGRSVEAVDTGRSTQGWFVFAAPTGADPTDLTVDVRLKFFDDAATMTWPLHDGENGRRFVRAAAWTPAPAGAPALEAARRAADLGRWAEALARYREDPAGLAEAADLLAARFRYDDAVAWIDEALARRPGDPALRQERLTYLLRAGRHAEVAAAEFAAPVPAAAGYMKAVAQLALGRPAEASTLLAALPPEFARERVVALGYLAWALGPRAAGDPFVKALEELHRAGPTPVLGALLGSDKEGNGTSLDEQIRVAAARGYHALARNNRAEAIARFQSVLAFRQPDAVEHPLAAALLKTLKP